MSFHMVQSFFSPHFWNCIDLYAFRAKQFLCFGCCFLLVANNLHIFMSRINDLIMEFTLKNLLIKKAYCNNISYINLYENENEGKKLNKMQMPLHWGCCYISMCHVVFSSFVIIWNQYSVLNHVHWLLPNVHSRVLHIYVSQRCPQHFYLSTV